MKILFIPCESAAISHVIPLIALYRKLNGTSVEAAFLIRREARKLLKQMEINVLDIDHKGFRSEVQAYGYYSPDVVVDDTSNTTGVASAVAKAPRVTIQRTGLFPGSRPRNSNHRHSTGMEKDIFPDTSFLGVPRAKTMHDLFKAEVKIVPGVRSIEVLPEHLQGDPSYHFSGPLLMEDLLISQFNSQIESDASNGVDYFKRFDLLESFFNKNQGRRVIYATFGTIAKAGSEVIECLKYLLKRDMAVVSNIYLEGLSEKDRSLYFFARYLPMHFVCSKSDLVIHHCGSGSYHYPIINHAPSITIGTQCYDRDDVAVRLEELGVSMHLPAPAEHGDFVRSFVEKVEQYFANSGALLNEKKKNLIPLREEIERTIEAFDFEGALKQAISSYRSLQLSARHALKYA